MAAIQISEVVINGIHTVLRSSAPKGQEQAREAVVFVHGNPGSGDDYSDLLPRVGEFSRTVAPDMPGFGKSGRPKDFDYTVQGYGRHLAGLLDQLGIEVVHLVLHDFGGPWGLSWASEHREQVASVTLFNMGVLPGYTWHKYARIWRTPIIGELFQLCTTRFAFRALLNYDNPKPFPESFINRMYDDTDWGMKRAVLKLYRATSDIEGLNTLFVNVLKSLSLPALVIWGDGDAYLPVAYADIQKEYFDAEVHIMPGCGHWPMIDEPDKVQELVVPFLRKQTHPSDMNMGLILFFPGPRYN